MNLSARVNRYDMLRYLGYGNQEISPSLERRIDRAITLCEGHIQPEGIYRVCAVDSCFSGTSGVNLVDTGLVLTGTAIARQLQGAVKVALLACTLGFESERLLRREEALNAVDGLLVDAAASSLVDEAVASLHVEVARIATSWGLEAGSRFSPGYGDLPLTVQPAFLRTVGADKQLGVGVTEANLLVPTKSVTAVVGLFPKKDQKNEKARVKRESLCDLCAIGTSCQLRKEGRTCYENN